MKTAQILFAVLMSTQFYHPLLAIADANDPDVAWTKGVIQVIDGSEFELKKIEETCKGTTPSGGSYVFTQDGESFLNQKCFQYENGGKSRIATVEQYLNKLINSDPNRASDYPQAKALIQKLHAVYTKGYSDGGCLSGSASGHPEDAVVYQECANKVFKSAREIVEKIRGATEKVASIPDLKQKVADLTTQNNKLTTANTKLQATVDRLSKDNLKQKISLAGCNKPEISTEMNSLTRMIPNEVAPAAPAAPAENDAHTAH